MFNLTVVASTFEHANILITKVADLAVSELHGIALLRKSTVSIKKHGQSAIPKIPWCLLDVELQRQKNTQIYRENIETSHGTVPQRWNMENESHGESLETIDWAMPGVPPFALLVGLPPW